MIKCDDTFREVMPKEMLHLSFMFLLVLSSMATAIFEGRYSSIQLEIPRVPSDAACFLNLCGRK